MRYAGEMCDTPDRGRSTYAECWGSGGKRGRVLSEHANLEEAIAACGGDPATDTGAVWPWIWDRRNARCVGKKRIAAVQATAAG